MTKDNNQPPIYTFSSFTEAMAVEAFGLEQELKAEGYLSEWMEKATHISIDEQETQQFLKC